MADHWVAIETGSELPCFAVEGGRNTNGEPTYVGRCWHEGELLPACVRPYEGKAYITCCGKIYIKDEYEILVGPGYGWSPFQYDGIQRNAVSTGHSSSTEPWYIGRGYHNGELLMGKIHVASNCLCVPYDEGETKVYDYEVLVKDTEDTWIAMNLEQTLPEQAVTAGQQSNGAFVYVARAIHCVDDNRKMLPAKYSVAQKKCLAVDSCSNVFEAQKFELLCGSNYTWLTPYRNEIPCSAVFTDRQLDGQPMFVGRTFYKGSWHCGMVAQDGESVIIPLGSKAIHVQDYEVLIKHKP